MRIIAIIILFLLVGCETTTVDLVDDKGNKISLTWRGTKAEYIRSDAVPAPSAPEKPDRNALIVLMGETAGDPTLGAELVIIAESAKLGRDKSAGFDALRLAKWFHDRDERRRRMLEGTESRAERAFGELPDPE